ncbi:MAG: HEAT repeat domain-containing protein [Planctomycetota bacterium]
MTKLERSLLVATLAVVGAAAGAWFALRATEKPATPADGASGAIPTPAAPGGRGAPGAIPGVADPADEPDDSALAARPGTGIPAGLRTPTGVDYSDPKLLQNLIREQLALENPRWDHVADWIGRVEGPIDRDIKDALLNALQFGNAAGAIQALERVRDGTIVPDLLRVLDDPKLDAHDRGNVLAAIAGVPGADLHEAVTGIESRLSGDFAHDGPYLVAIARLGGLEGARALSDAVNATNDPSRFGAEVWRSFDLRRSKEASDYLARVLTDAPRSEAALVSLLDLTGRPGATPALVTAMLALDAPEQREPVRRAALVALGKTGDDAAVTRLIELAEKGADYASVAARALGTTTSLSDAARTKVIEVAKTTTNDYLKQNAVEALGATRTVAAVPVLTDLAKHGSDLVRREAVRALGRMGAEAAGAVEAIGAAYGSGDEAMRQQAVLALAQIATPEAKGVLEQARASEASPIVKKTVEAAWRALQAKLAREPK